MHVGIYDDGVQRSHPDLSANYDASLHVSVGGEVIDAEYGASVWFSPHGTSVAGLIAAANNGTGTVGVAYGAWITGVTIFSGPADINNSYEGFIEAIDQSENFDVINHSWGCLAAFFQSGGVPEEDQALLSEWLEALDAGRNGLGTIQVKAAGNDDMNANGDTAGSTRATIVVGAYNDDGDAAYYSNFGANLLISAPSSGGNENRGIVTTDLVGLNGYNMVDANGEYLTEPDYTDMFGGTSAATPIVTGVIALMLDANPNLSWRDVQNIVAYSAREVGSGVGGVRTESEDHDWRYNGADT